MNWKEFVLNGLMPTLESAGEAYLEELLEKLSYLDKEQFATDLQGSHSLFSRLKVLAEKTKTKIDDGIAEAVLEAIENVAEAHDIELTPAA